MIIKCWLSIGKYWLNIGKAFKYWLDQYWLKYWFKY